MMSIDIKLIRHANDSTTTCYKLYLDFFYFFWIGTNHSQNRMHTNCGPPKIMFNELHGIIFIAYYIRPSNFYLKILKTPVVQC